MTIFLILFCVIELYARAGGGQSFSSSRSSFSSGSSRPSFGSSSRSYGSSSTGRSSSSGSSYSGSSSRMSSMRSYSPSSNSSAKKVTINNYNVTNISQQTGYHQSHPFNNPFVWMMIMNSGKHKDSNISDEDFEKQAHQLLLKKVCDDFYIKYNELAEGTKVTDKKVIVISKNKEYEATYSTELRKTLFFITCDDIAKRNKEDNMKVLKIFGEFVLIIGSVIGLFILITFLMGKYEDYKWQKEMEKRKL